METPKLIKIRQAFDCDKLEDVYAETLQQVRQSGFAPESGARVAIAVGSRGIANIARIVAAIVEGVREKGGEPFIVPAMGSHGGATAEGQRAVLEGYGITEEHIKAPIVSSMKVVEMDSAGLAHRLFLDANAAEADHIIAVNRVKPHTDFHGTTESGILKMLVIGLGKHAQALIMHSFGVRGLREYIPQAARKLIASGKISLGIGICENAYDQTAVIRAALPEDIEKVELELIDWARANMPSIPVDTLDVLIVDAMGKDVSGVGIDTNIIGRMMIEGEPEPLRPRIKQIVVDDLTDGSHGNALGMGLADFVTEKFRGKIDFAATYENIITSTFPKRGFMPVVAKNAKTAVDYALRCSHIPDEITPRVMRIQSTLKLDEMYVSESVLRELEKNSSIAIIGEACGLFCEDGELTAF